MGESGRSGTLAVVGRNAVVFAFLLAVLGLGLRTQITGDTRFGWGMFSHQTNFVVVYEWIDADGEARLVGDTAADLPGRQSIISGERYHSTRYGHGAVKRWVRAYLEHLYEERRPPDAVAVRARMAYQVDGVLSETSDHEIDVQSFPEGR